MTRNAENDVCRCVPDDEVTARDADTGEPLEYVRVPGFWGWFRSGWREVVCPVHAPTYHPPSGGGLFDADETRPRLWWCGPCQDYHEGTCPIPPAADQGASDA